MRKYPVGIQSFETIRSDGYIYVDKTPYIHKMLTTGKTFFLSRPRRFGKSLLVSTFHALFDGRQELFDEIVLEDGTVQPRLFIANTNWKWEKYPVFRFDFSQAGKNEISSLNTYIDQTLSRLEQQYNIESTSDDHTARFVNLVLSAHNITGKKVVVLVDEYDNQMLNSIGDEEKELAVRETFSGLFAPLKGLDDHIQFVFITGISKFSQMGIFSRLNNLNNISMHDDYDAICGISEDELKTVLHEDLELLAERCGKTFNDTVSVVKRRYDGYHFNERMTDIYNPFSLVKTLESGKLSDYWFESATPSSLINMLAQMPPIELGDLECVRCKVQDFDTPFDNYGAPVPVLYQSGYLTIKDFDPKRDIYTLGFPNEEVRHGFADILYKYVTGLQGKSDPGRNVFLDAYYDFYDTGDLPPFVEAIKTFFSGIPYLLANNNERHYHVVLYTLLTSFGADVKAEEPSAKGRADIILTMPFGIYVIEIKYDGTADEALAQIEAKGYADKYRLDGRKLTMVGMSFSSEERNITEWKAI